MERLRKFLSDVKEVCTDLKEDGHLSKAAIGVGAIALLAFIAGLIVAC